MNIHYLNEDDRSRRLLYSLAITALVMLTITAHTLAFQSEVVMEKMAQEERAERLKYTASHYAEIVAGCMNGNRVVWTDPHTGSDYQAVCEVVELGKVVQ